MPSENDSHLFRFGDNLEQQRSFQQQLKSHIETMFVIGMCEAIYLNLFITRIIDCQSEQSYLVIEISD